jgi:hypothetical protein
MELNTLYLEQAICQLDGFVMKRNVKNGQRLIEYRIVGLRPDDQSLFETPVGYQKFSMPGKEGPQP